MHDDLPAEHEFRLNVNRMMCNTGVGSAMWHQIVLPCERF